MSVAAASEYDTRLVRGIQTALQTARELGYHVETMDITASVTGGVCTIQFAPMTTESCLIGGGDLTVAIDAASNQVLRYERGQ